MELKQNKVAQLAQQKIVLIVPFMELKQKAYDDAEKDFTRLNRTFYGIETAELAALDFGKAQS